MNILIVDNGTKTLAHLCDLAKKFGKVKVVEFSKFSELKLTNFDLIILSGSSTLNVVKDRFKLTPEIEFIKHTKIPILGICFGFQLICLTYDSVIEDLKETIDDFRIIKVIKNDLINMDGSFIVKEHHKWAVTKTSDVLIPLANSSSGIEIIKHRSKNQYGFQFHPESFENITSGDEIFTQVIEAIKNPPTGGLVNKLLRLIKS